MRNTVMLAAAALAAAGCYAYPSSDDRWGDEIVATRYDPDVDFTSYRTFAISQTVDYVDAESDDDEIVTFPADLAKPLIDRVRTNLESRGYTEVSGTQVPDLGVKLAVRKGTVAGVEYIPYWSWGYPYSYGYSYYYPYTMPVYTSYNTGVVTVDIIDLDNPAVPGGRAATPPGDGGLGDAGAPDAGEPDAGAAIGTTDGGIPLQLRAAWTGAVYGVLDKVGTEEVAEAADGIDKAFAQSPYLRRNP